MQANVMKQYKTKIMNYFVLSSFWLATFWSRLQSSSNMLAENLNGPCCFLSVFQLTDQHLLEYSKQELRYPPHAYLEVYIAHSYTFVNI